MRDRDLFMDFSKGLMEEKEYVDCESALKAGWDRLCSGKEAFTDWVKLPAEYDRSEFERIKETAARIRKQCDALVVIGIGGSYLGLRAAEAMLDPAEKGPEIIYAGNNISGTYHAELLEGIEDREVCLCVISKSGTTTEPSIAFALLKDFMHRKYGKEEASRRIYAITDQAKGTLREEADREGYESFVVPDNIGGRYSVLSPVGLLPMAACGIDIDAMMQGAADALADAGMKQQAEKYAAFRHRMFERGKVIEVFEYYEPELQYFAEWLKQLFGESEGKEGKGVFPAALQFSTDLHSMGQFLQQGNQIFFETVLHVKKPKKDITVPESAGSPLAGMSMNRVNEAAVSGVIAAHQKAEIPILKLDLPELSPYCFGQMVYFFEAACALSCYLTGVNPFDQPGVESYKEEMRKALK